MTKHFAFLALLLSAAVAAADPPADPKTPDAPMTPMAAPAADASAITPAQLGEMLNDLGYDVKDVSLDKKADSYTVTSDRDGWKLFINVSLSTDRQYVWFDVKFKPLADATVASPGAWLKLLDLTRQYHPVHFALDKSGRIHVSEGTPNVGLTADDLRKELDSFDDIVRHTQDAWKASAFAK
jgi:hypothetical protein